MTESEHTQGPWNAPLLNGETTGLVWADEPYGGVIASVHQLAKKDFGTTTANAHLIAAAPDLFDALEMAVDYTNCMHPEIGGCIRAAIAKAKGETP